MITDKKKITSNIIKGNWGGKKSHFDRVIRGSISEEVFLSWHLKYEKKKATQNLSPQEMFAGSWCKVFGQNRLILLEGQKEWCVAEAEWGNEAREESLGSSYQLLKVKIGTSCKYI